MQTDIDIDKDVANVNFNYKDICRPRLVGLVFLREQLRGTFPVLTFTS